MFRDLRMGRLPRQRVLPFAIALAAALAVGGCGGSATKDTSSSATGASFYTAWPPGGTPVRGGTITIDSNEAPASFDPFKGATAQQSPYEIFDQLFELMPGASGNSAPRLEPALASSWTVSSDKLTYKFHIRPGVRFSNGEPVTGEDVLFSLKQMQQPLDTASVFTKPWKKISLTGPMTVQLQLSEPEAVLRELLSAYSASVVPKKVYEREGGKDFGLHPVGSGAFMLKSATPGFTTMRMVRNPHYWRTAQPYADELVWNLVESETARILAVRSGAATIALAVPYAQVASLEHTPGVRMLVGPEWGASQVMFNRRRAPYDEVNVRRALMYATPREQIVKSVYDGLGTVANSLWGRLKYWDPKVPLYPYDIAKAKELLKESSVPSGFEVTIATPSGEAQGAQVASILQSSWARLGVHASIQSLQTTTLSSNFYAGKYEVDVLPTAEGFFALYNPDAIFFYVDNTEAGGYSPPGSEKLVSQLKEATTSTSEAQREELFKKMQHESYWEEALFIPVVDLVSLNLVSPSLHGFQVMPNAGMRLERAWLQR